MLIVLPWPPPELSPNSRTHWSPKARAAGRYRFICATLTRTKAGERQFAIGRIPVTLEFVPPDRRRRDVDNMLAAMKAGLDGVADALRVNDSRFELTLRVADEVGGFVRVTL